MPKVVVPRGRGRGPPRCGADRISDLPDHLLHRILICLPSIWYAARTSVLSRRWRRLWTDLPELTFLYDISPKRVDAALAAWSAPVLHRLEIGLAWFYSPHITTGHVRSWLRFASQHLAGELSLWQRLEIEEVVLPVSGRFTAVSIAFVDYTPRLRFQVGGGVFTALAALTINHARLENRELEELVSSRCPRLKELVLESIFLLSRHDILSIQSDSLEKLRVLRSLEKIRIINNHIASNATMFDDDGSLQVATPELQELSMCLWSDGKGEGTNAHVVAPKLSKVYWRNFYDPRRHQIVEAGRHLKRLELTCRSLGLLGRFDAVDELHLHIFLPEGEEEYMRILEDDASKIRCAVLVVKFSIMSHVLEPIMLHLLRKCVGVRKLVVGFETRMPYPCKLSGYPCDFLAHDHLTNGILLDSLQEVVVERAEDTKQVMEIVGLLCRCSETFQKKVHITISQGNRRLRSMDMRRHIDDILLRAPNNKVEVTIH